MTVPPDPAPTAARSWRRELALLVAFCVGLGAVAGLAWYLVAPTPAFVVESGSLVYRKELPGEYVAMDGWFAVIALVAGVITAVVVLRRGPLTGWRVLAMALSALLGAWAMWRVGSALSPASTTLEDGPGVLRAGTVVHGKLDLNAKGVLLIWPVVSLLIVTFALAWSAREDGPKHAPERADATGGDDDGQALVGRHPDLGDVDRG